MQATRSTSSIAAGKHGKKEARTRYRHEAAIATNRTFCTIESRKKPKEAADAAPEDMERSMDGQKR
jgi:hypothetical protein